jgi:hypothetical protein
MKVLRVGTNNQLVSMSTAPPFQFAPPPKLGYTNVPLVAMPGPTSVGGVYIGPLTYCSRN